MNDDYISTQQFHLVDVPKSYEKKLRYNNNKLIDQKFKDKKIE